MQLTMQRVVALVAFGLAALAFGTGAEAGITYTLSDGIPADTVVLTDGGTGQITFNNIVVGNFTVSGTLDGPPHPSDQGLGFLSQTQNTVNVVSTGGGTLTLTMVDQGLTLSPSQPTATLVSNISDSRFGTEVGGPPAGSQFTFQSWLNPANTTTPGGATGGIQGPYTTAPISNGLNTAVSVPSTPFSLINQLVLTATGPLALADTGTTQLEGAVPEPATITLVGTALPLIGLALRRRRRIPG